MNVFARLKYLALALIAIAGAPAAAAPPQSGGNDKEPYKIDADKLDYYENEQKMVYRGDVIAIRGETKVRSSVMTIYLEKSANGEETSVRHIDAEGPVTVMEKDKVGTGDKGVYDRDKNALYLEGNVTLTQGANVTKGNKLVYDMTTKRAQVYGGASTGRVMSVFTPDADKGPAKPKH